MGFLFFDYLGSGDAGFFRLAGDGLDDGLYHRFVLDCGGWCACFAGCGWRDWCEHDRARAALGVVRRFVAFFHLACLGTRDRELAPHEGLVVEYFDAADCVVHVEHLHEAVAFGSMGRAVVHDFHAADGAHALEQFLKVLFGDIVGQVANINAGGFDRRWVATARAFGAAAALTFAGFRRALGGACVAGVGLGGFGFAVGFGGFLFALRACGLFVEADELQELLPPGERFFAAGWAGRLESELLGATRSG